MTEQAANFTPDFVGSCWVFVVDSCWHLIYPHQEVSTGFRLTPMGHYWHKLINMFS